MPHFPYTVFLYSSEENMRKLGEDPPLQMEYLEGLRQKMRATGDEELRVLLSEIRRLQRLVLLGAHYTRTVMAPGGSVRINASLLEDLHRQCHAEPIVIKDQERKRQLLAPSRLSASDIPLHARANKETKKIPL
tara:strand:+ start:1975 stop:2376 length:402 start_codon:yes stop_codon:yes gene_type:complete